MEKNGTDFPWVEKYRPQSIKEMALPTAKLKNHRIKLEEELMSFIRDFFKEKKEINKANKEIRRYNRTHAESDQKEELQLAPEKAGILLEGPPGIGKTSIVYALANDLNMDVIETNASDVRTKQAIETALSETVKSRGILDFIIEVKEKLILIDEIDGIYGVQDRGAVPAIIELLKNTQFPVIMCSNEYKQSLQPIYNLIKKMEVNPLSDDEIRKVIIRIFDNENIKNLKQDDLKLIIEKNHGDLRGIINDMQGISQGAMNGDNSELISTLFRDSTEEIFSLIRDLFQNVKSLKEARSLTDKSDVDYNLLYKWVNENLPTFLKANDELKVAYDNLSTADQIFGRIRKEQYWSLLPYFYDLFSGGVVLARKRQSVPGFQRIYFPRFTSTGYLSLSASERQFVDKIKEVYQISDIEVMQEFLPFLKLLTQSSRKELKKVTDWLELSAQEKKLLK
jgi:replication factor C large subunit